MNLAKRIAQALTPTPSEPATPDKAPDLAEGGLARLKEVADGKLADCYDNFGDYLFDFYPGLPWSEPGFSKAVNWILANPEFPRINAAIQQKYNFDMKADLEAALHDND